MGDESAAGAETVSKSEQKRRQKAEKKAAEKVNSVTSVAVCFSRIRIFPSWIQGQKDTGSRIRIKEVKFFSPKIVLILSEI
jgi:hypothetical protein